MADDSAWAGFGKFVAFAIVATVIVTALAGGLAATTNIDETIRENHQAFNELCTDVYGDDAYTYSSNTVGSHGGLHCEGDDPGENAFHLSQIPDDNWRQYKAGEVSSQYVASHLEPQPGVVGTNQDGLLPVALLVSGAAIVIGFVGHVRDTDSE